MKRIGFRSRLFVILLSFALVPSAVLATGWFATSRYAFSLVGATAAWDSVAAGRGRGVLQPLRPVSKPGLPTSFALVIVVVTVAAAVLLTVSLL